MIVFERLLKECLRFKVSVSVSTCNLKKSIFYFFNENKFCGFLFPNNFNVLMTYLKLIEKKNF
jgi:hypothetical protein